MKKILNKNINTYKGRILIIDDEPEVGWIFSKILGDDGYEVISSQTGSDGLKRVREFMPNLVFLDLKIPDKNGMSILKEIRKLYPDIMIIMITAHETIQTAVSATKQGAYDYIPKPIPNERLKIIVDNALKHQMLAKRVDFLTKADTPLGEIIGQSQPMQEFFGLIRKIASHDISVILKGESGTGKELTARAIHNLSKRKDKPFIPLDCATLPDALVESELFGYEKGAFTGADTIKIGKFELANEGTIFLDEIGNLTTHIQVKLLRVLQERKIERLGGKEPIKIDVRIITATNRNLEEAIKSGDFRNDLYHRLNVFEIMLPPLRERKEDIIILSQYFLDKFNKEQNKKVNGFSDEVLGMLRSYHWPGNVRELENVIKSGVVLAKEEIAPRHLPPCIKTGIGDNIKTNNLGVMGLSGLSKDFDKTSMKEAKKTLTKNAEKYFIEKTLKETSWNKKKTARILDIDYKSLFTKIKKYNITR